MSAGGKRTMAVEGTLDVFRLPEILQVISHQRKTGILTVQGENDIVAVSFLDGSVVAADALNQTVDEKLGEVLEREGMAAREEFAEVAAAARQGDGRLIDLLVERGVVGRAELMAAMRTQTYDLLFDLLAWESGEFKFYSGDEVAYEEGFRPIPIEELLLRAIAEGEDDGEGALPARGVLYARVEPPPCELRERVGPPRPGEERDGVLWISADEQRLWELLETPQSVEELTAAAGLGEHQVRFALYRFLAAGAAEHYEPGEDGVPEPFVAPPPLPEPAAAPRVAARSAAAPAAPRRSGLQPVEMPGDETLDRLTRVPEPAPLPARRPVAPGRAAAFAAHLLALLVVAAAGAALVRSPADFLLPFPWQQGERDAEAALRFDAAAVRIDRAAKTWFLLEGGFPESLGRLLGPGLLGGGDLTGPGGRPYAYASGVDAYRLRPADAPEDAGHGEAISGNFLLDPDFQAGAGSGQTPPLILLD
jgi:hypothetical protein